MKFHVNHRVIGSAVAGLAVILASVCPAAAQGTEKVELRPSVATPHPIATDVRVAGDEKKTRFILDLDRRNPQTAARLLTHFRSWRAIEPVRRMRAETALRRIADAADLSPDTRDIITRTLA